MGVKKSAKAASVKSPQKAASKTPTTQPSVSGILKKIASKTARKAACAKKIISIHASAAPIKPGKLRKKDSATRKGGTNNGGYSLRHDDE
jgi:hypothetical protein